MPTETLQPFQNPFDTLSQYGIFIPSGSALFISLSIIFALWFIYTLILIYHWLKYSHGSWVAYPALITHVTVSVALLLYAFIAITRTILV